MCRWIELRYQWSELRCINHRKLSSLQWIRLIHWLYLKFATFIFADGDELLLKLCLKEFNRLIFVRTQTLLFLRSLIHFIDEMTSLVSLLLDWTRQKCMLSLSRICRLWITNVRVFTLYELLTIIEFSYLRNSCFLLFLERLLGLKYTLRLCLIIRG